MGAISRGLLVGLAVLLVLVGVVGWRFYSMFFGGAGGAGFPMPPVEKPVEAVRLTPRTVEQLYETAGTVEARQQAVLRSEVNGRVVSAPFEEGDWVTAGQVLFVVEPDQIEAQVLEKQEQLDVDQFVSQQRSAQIQQLQADVALAQERYNQAKREFARYEQLHRQEYLSDLELEQFRSTLEQAEASYRAARQAVAAAQASYQQARQQQQVTRSQLRQQQAILQDFRVTAPFAGYVASKQVRPGDGVTTQTELTTLIQPQPMDAVLDIPERFVDQVAVGLTLYLGQQNSQQQQDQPGEGQHTETRPQPRLPYTATVRYISPLVQSDTRTVQLKATLAPSAEKRFRHGQLVTLQVPVARHNQTLVVPAPAVQYRNGQPFVFVAAPASEVPAPPPTMMMGPPPTADKPQPQPARRVKAQPVTLGLKTEREVELTSGVQPGDWVITGSLQLVQEGMGVKPLTPQQLRQQAATEAARQSQPGANNEEQQ